MNRRGFLAALLAAPAAGLARAQPARSSGKYYVEVNFDGPFRYPPPGNFIPWHVKAAQVRRQS